MLAAGYTAGELEKVLGEQDAAGKPVFASFMDVPKYADFSAEDIDNSVTMKLFQDLDIPFLPSWMEEKFDHWIMHRLLNRRVYPLLFSLVERGGLYVGNALLDWFGQKLAAKDPAYATMTLGQLYEATKQDLSLVATDTTQKEMLVLNHRTAPNCPVTWAVRMSMSIPFAWHEVRWQSAWNPYRLYDAAGTGVKEERALTDHAIVDGGVLSNFPINMFTSNNPEVRAVMGGAQDTSRAVL